MSYVPPKPSSSFYRHSRDSHRGRDDRHGYDIHSRHHETSATPVVSQTVDCSQISVPSKERLVKIATENGLDPEALRFIWTEPWPDVRRHLFDPTKNGMPRFILKTEIWKPLIKTYFSLYSIPREQCTHIWADIVDMLLLLPPAQSGDAEFKSWAYGCMCKFYLEDRQMSRLSIHAPTSGNTRHAP